MSKKEVIMLIIVMIVVISGVWYWAHVSGSNPGTYSVGSSTAVSDVPISTTTASSSGIVAGASSTGELFSGSIYAPYAYLISTSTLPSSTLTALGGFVVRNSSNADGSMEVVVTAPRAEYQTRTYTLQPGESLYFIARSAGDGLQSLPINDSTVFVGSNGYIIQVDAPVALTAEGKG